MKQLLGVKVTEIINALERESANTDTDPRWLAASELRHMEGWESRTLMCSVETEPKSQIIEFAPHVSPESK